MVYLNPGLLHVLKDDKVMPLDVGDGGALVLKRTNFFGYLRPLVLVVFGISKSNNEEFVLVTCMIIIFKFVFACF